MPQSEITNNRPSNYSRWHRTVFAHSYYMVDGDWFEQRLNPDGTLETVAYIETIQIPVDTTPKKYPVWEAKECLANEINDKMGIPAFIVWHTCDCKTFFVRHVKRDNVVKMYENDYIQFIKGIGKRVEVNGKLLL